jgi:hypothetical protein
MNRVALASVCGLLLLLAACGTFEISVDSASTTNVATIGTVDALQTQNAQLVTTMVVVMPATDSFISVPSTVTNASAVSTTTAVPPATRITFLNGASVVVVSAPIAPGQTQSYVLDALQAQPMFVYVASGNDDVTVSIKADDETTILDAGAKKVSWQGALPRTGDYYLTIHGGKAVENFTMTVTLPWRLRFAAGENSATVSGKTVAGYNVSYTVFASKGQSLKVHLDEISSKASLSIYGFTDGQRYLRSDAGQRGYQFTLPATQDYIVVIVPYGGSEVDYMLTINIQ